MKVKIRSIFAIGITEELRTQLESEGELTVTLKKGSPVETLLRRFPHLGPPETYDDMMIHVFVNGELKGFDHVLQGGETIDIHIPVSGG